MKAGLRHSVQEEEEEETWSSGSKRRRRRRRREWSHTHTHKTQQRLEAHTSLELYTTRLPRPFYNTKAE
jgi:hypothetical protein